MQDDVIECLKSENARLRGDLVVAKKLIEAERKPPADIEIHNVFSYSKMAAELAELYADAKNVPDDTPISKILGDGAGMV